MKRSKFTEEQIIAILREQEAGAKTAEVCRRRIEHWPLARLRPYARGTNQPNVFFDPKSSESFTPYFSRG